MRNDDWTLDELQRLFAESNWPLVGDFRSYIYFRLWVVLSDFSRSSGESETIRSALETHMDSRASLEAMEESRSVRERLTSLFQELTEIYSPAGFSSEPLRAVESECWRLCELMEEVRARIGTRQLLLNAHFESLLHVGVSLAEADIEFRAEEARVESQCRAILREVTLRRNAVLWEESEESLAAYYVAVRELLEGRAYRELREHLVPREDQKAAVERLLKSTEDLEVLLLVESFF